jgi:hypothetical protein
VRTLLIVFVVCVASRLTGCGVGSERDSLPPLDVSITTHLGDAQTFRDGDPLSFFISLGSDAHVLMLYEDASGAVIQLLPNADFQTTLVPAGEFISMPPPDAPFTLRVAAPFGAEKVWLIASEKPLPGLPSRRVANGVPHVDGDVATIRETLQAHALSNRSRYGEASVRIVTQPSY